MQMSSINPQKTRLIGSRRLFPLGYELNLNDLIFRKDIKNKDGAYGIIDFFEDKKAKGQIYARKTSKGKVGKRDKLYIYREINILIKVQHLTIIPFIGYSIEKQRQEDHEISIFTKYMKNGSLYDILEKEKKKQLPKDFAKKKETKKQIILVGIARGMMLLHKNFVIHRDLKPSNVMLDDEYKPRISDFGLSKIFNPFDPQQSDSFIGSVAYMAPEVIDGVDYNTKADVYSFGILMYEVVTGSQAYPKINSPYKLTRDVSNGLRPDYKKVKKKSLRRMIRFCLEQNQTKRPCFAELYNKLSLSEEELFYNTGYGICEPIINEEEKEKEEEEEEEEGDEVNPLSNKYCLDDIDIDELQKYIEEIDDEYANDNIDEELEDVKTKTRLNENNISKLENENKQLFEESEKMNHIITTIENVNKNLQQNSNKLMEDHNQLKNSLSILFELCTNLTNNQDKIRYFIQLMNQYDKNLPQIPNCGNKQSPNCEKPPFQLPDSANKSLLQSPNCENKSPQQLPYNENRSPQQLSYCEKRSSQQSPNCKKKGYSRTIDLAELKDLNHSSVNENESQQHQSICEKKNPRQSLNFEKKNPRQSPTCEKKNPRQSPTCEKKNPRQSPTCEKKNPRQSPTCEKKSTRKSLNFEKKNLQQSSTCEKKSRPQTIAVKKDSSEQKNLNYLPKISPKYINTQSTEINKVSYNILRENIINREPLDIDTIPTELFKDIKNIELIQIPYPIKNIEMAAFSGCSSLKYIIISSSVTYIGNFAFYECTSLIDIKLPPSLTAINTKSFYGCSSLTCIEIPSNVKTIGIAAFKNCKSLKTVKIPSSVEKIEKSAFSCCTSLESIDIPSKVTVIEYSTFSGCTSLQKVSLPESLKNISYLAFENCRSLLRIEIPSLIESIDPASFSECISLRYVKMPNAAKFYNVFQDGTVIDKY